MDILMPIVAKKNSQCGMEVPVEERDPLPDTSSICRENSEIDQGCKEVHILELDHLPVISSVHSDAV